MAEDVVYHGRNRYWLNRSKKRCNEETTAGRERRVEDVVLENVYEEGRIEQREARGERAVAWGLGRELWGFGPGYFSGGLEGGE
jgi:hypothetical protein